MRGSTLSTPSLISAKYDRTGSFKPSKYSATAVSRPACTASGQRHNRKSTIICTLPDNPVLGPHRISQLSWAVKFASVPFDFLTSTFSHCPECILHTHVHSRNAHLRGAHTHTRPHARAPRWHHSYPACLYRPPFRPSECERAPDSQTLPPFLITAP